VKRTLNVTAGDGTRLKFAADTDGVIGRKMMRGRIYESELLEHIRSREFGGAAIDVGAHIGTHTVYLAKVCGLYVHAFEAASTEDLYDNVVRNDVQDRVRIYEHALGATEGRARWISSITLAQDPEGPVRLVPLDEFGFDDVALIKADVEQMEPDVLRGAEETIARCHPTIYAEAQDAAASRELAAVLEPMGYEQLNRFASKSVATPVEEWIPRFPWP
jgi:FkbM family methyltransferase